MDVTVSPLIPSPSKDYKAGKEKKEQRHTGVDSHTAFSDRSVAPTRGRRTAFRFGDGCRCVFGTYSVDGNCRVSGGGCRCRSCCWHRCWGWGWNRNCGCRGTGFRCRSSAWHRGWGWSWDCRGTGCRSRSRGRDWSWSCGGTGRGCRSRGRCWGRTGRRSRGRGWGWTRCRRWGWGRLALSGAVLRPVSHEEGLRPFRKRFVTPYGAIRYADLYLQQAVRQHKLLDPVQVEGYAVGPFPVDLMPQVDRVPCGQQVAQLNMRLVAGYEILTGNYDEPMGQIIGFRHRAVGRHRLDRVNDGNGVMRVSRRRPVLRDQNQSREQDNGYY